MLLKIEELQQMPSSERNKYIASLSADDYHALLTGCYKRYLDHALDRAVEEESHGDSKEWRENFMKEAAAYTIAVTSERQQALLKSTDEQTKRMKRYTIILIIIAIVQLAVGVMQLFAFTRTISNPAHPAPHTCPYK